MPRPISLDDSILALNGFDQQEQLVKDRLHDLLQAACETDHQTGCWIYTGCWEGNGQGKVRVGRRVYGVHRVAAWLYGSGYELWDVTRVVHRACCPSPACFNPDHLEILGSQAEAILHQAARGRLGKHHRHLSRAKAREIRALAATGLDESALALLYAVAVPSIRAVLRGDTWPEKEALHVPV